MFGVPNEQLIGTEALQLTNLLGISPALLRHNCGNRWSTGNNMKVEKELRDSRGDLVGHLLVCSLCTLTLNTESLIEAESGGPD